MIDFDTDWVKLEWDKPEFDGGSTITGYIIEKRDKQFQKWEVCTRSGIKCTVKAFRSSGPVQCGLSQQIKIV